VKDNAAEATGRLCAETGGGDAIAAAGGFNSS